MNKKIATFFICSFIALVNSTPIDGADNANVSTVGNSQYEVTPMPARDSVVIKTVPPSHEGKSGGLPSTVTATNAPKAVSFVTPPVTVPVHVAKNASNDSTIVPPPVPVDPTTKDPITPPTIAPTLPPPTNSTDVTTPSTTTVPITTTVVTTPTTPTTVTTNPPTTTTPATTSGTTTTPLTTTSAPAPTAAPSKDRRFDGPSFIGGIVLSLGIMAIGFVAWKFYKARTERNYHTL